MSSTEKPRRRLGRKATMLIVGGVATAVTGVGVVAAHAETVVTRKYDVYPTYWECNVAGVIFMENLSASTFEKADITCPEIAAGQWQLTVTMTFA